jgi:hypothetical protein
VIGASALLIFAKFGIGPPLDAHVRIANDDSGEGEGAEAPFSRAYLVSCLSWRCFSEKASLAAMGGFIGFPPRLALALESSASTPISCELDLCHLAAVAAISHRRASLHRDRSSHETCYRCGKENFLQHQLTPFYWIEYITIVENVRRFPRTSRPSFKALRPYEPEPEVGGLPIVIPRACCRAGYPRLNCVRRPESFAGTPEQLLG